MNKEQLILLIEQIIKEEIKKNNIELLPLISIEEEGKKFSTNIPVEFRFLKNTNKAPKMGSRFQQDIEPAGFYCVHVENPIQLSKEFITGIVKLNKPLVIEFNTKNNGYDENSWKMNLYNVFKKKGKSLSKQLMNLGYDGIITVDKRGYTSEIVILDTSKIIQDK
jgi:hypothetical protein